MGDSGGTRGNTHVLFRNMGFAINGAEIWMRITNETEYRAWNPRHNGVKRQEEGTTVGMFGAINLLGPRSTTQRSCRAVAVEDGDLPRELYEW